VRKKRSRRTVLEDAQAVPRPHPVRSSARIADIKKKKAVTTTQASFGIPLEEDDSTDNPEEQEALSLRSGRNTTARSRAGNDEESRHRLVLGSKSSNTNRASASSQGSTLLKHNTVPSIYHPRDRASRFSSQSPAISALSPAHVIAHASQPTVMSTQNITMSGQTMSLPSPSLTNHHAAYSTHANHLIQHPSSSAPSYGTSFYPVQMGRLEPYNPLYVPPRGSFYPQSPYGYQAFSNGDRSTPNSGFHAINSLPQTTNSTHVGDFHSPYVSDPTTQLHRRDFE